MLPVELPALASQAVNQGLDDAATLVKASRFPDEVHVVPACGALCTNTPVDSDDFDDGVVVFQSKVKTELLEFVASCVAGNKISQACV